MSDKKTGKLSKEKLMGWLENGTEPLSVDTGNYATLLIQLPKSENISYIYSQSQYKGSGSYVREQFNYCCLYDRKNNLLCGGSYPLTHLFELGRDDYVTEGALRERLQEAVRSMVENAVDNDRTNLTVQEVTDFNLKRSLDYYLEHGVKEAAIRHLFADGAFLNSGYQCHYEPDNWTEDSLLEYLHDSEGYAQTRANEYIQSHQEQILSALIENEALRTAFDELMQDAGSPVHRMKKITDALNLCDAKTVRVTIMKDGEEFSFKTEASSLKGHHNYYSTYSMTAPDRREFESRFGRSANYHAEDIVKITYGKKDIYTAELPEQEMQSGSGPVMTMGGIGL